MDKAPFGWFGIPILVFVLVSAACSFSAPPPVPTSTSAALGSTPTAILVPTVTPRPTATLRPTTTPDLAATEETADRLAELQFYQEKGYITTTDGTFTDIPEFHQERAKIDYYMWWPVAKQPHIHDAFVFRGHFGWSVASQASDLSGCGIVFGVRSDGFHYAVFLDRSRIVFLRSGWEVGKTRGTGRVNIAAPYEAEVAVIVNGKTGYVLVNGQATQYSLMDEQPAGGTFALSVLSGINKDYGTRCDITNAYLWTP